MYRRHFFQFSARRKPQSSTKTKKCEFLKSGGNLLINKRVKLKENWTKFRYIKINLTEASRTDIHTHIRT